MSFSRAELMSVVLARALREGDVVVTGTNAAIPTAAYRLAQARHAPHMVAINGAHGTIDPVANEVPQSSADPALIEGRFNISLADVVAAETRRVLDVVFIGALQIDLLGRCNLALIGPPEAPVLRGPGTLGLTAATVVDRTLIYLTRHDRRTFVEEVDFVSVEAMRGGGLELIVTPLAVLAPDPERERLRLVSVHPGVSVGTVHERTGFDLGPPSDGLTAAPEADELKTLREIDRVGELQAMTLEER